MEARRHGMLGTVLAGLVLWVPGIASAQSSVRELELGGSATFLNDQCVRLTPDEPFLTGSAWHPRPIDLAKPFSMNVSVVLGERDALGADGIVFVFHPEMRTGWRGEGMGFSGLEPSLGVEIDTYQNFHLDDPAADHLALMRDGSSYHGPGSRPVEVGDLEDGRRHPLDVRWDPQRGIEVRLDGVLRVTSSADEVLAIFGEKRTVHWGVTAATGRKTNAQDVCIESIRIGGSTRRDRDTWLASGG